MIRHRICEKCGKPFTPKRIDARFHSDACRSAARHDAESVSVRIRAAKNALSALFEVASAEDEEWWTATLRELHDHIGTDAARIAAEREVP